MRDLLHNVVVGLAVSFVALSLGAAFGILSGRGASPDRRNSLDARDLELSEG